MEDAEPVGAAAEGRDRNKDRLVGIAIIAVAFVASLGLSLWASRASRPQTSQPPGPPTTAGLVGYPHAVDPVRALDAARAVTARDLLRGIDAEGVKSDGTVDVSTGLARVRYTFQSAPGEGPQPPREEGVLARSTYCGKQTVHLKKEGLVADPDLASYPCATQHEDALPEPRCDMRAVWQRAVAKGAPKDHLARIDYYRSRAGPAWRFDMPGTQVHFSLYGDCGRELDEREAVTVLP